MYLGPLADLKARQGLPSDIEVKFYVTCQVSFCGSGATFCQLDTLRRRPALYSTHLQLASGRFRGRLSQTGSITILYIRGATYL